MKPDISLTDAMSDPNLFGSVFAAPSFWTWRVVAKLIDGIALTEQREINLYQECTGKTYSKDALHTVHRLILLAGRRAGKDRFFSAVAVWRAALCANWRKHISAGKQAVVILLGADKKQAAILRRYCQGLLAAPLVAKEVTRNTGEVTEFRNGASLEISTNDARLVRGRSAIAVLGSECCHWRTDEHAASSDEEVVGAAEPSMAMCPDGGLLMLGSSVHRRKGYMYRQFKKLHGNNDNEDICWFAPSVTMNSKIPQSVIDRALSEDPHKAKAEYQNIWREDVDDFIPSEVIDGCTDFDCFERPPLHGIRYVAFTDAAGGLGSDSFTLAICHRLSDGSRVVMLDVLRERKPRFAPHEVVREFAQLLKAYGISEVWGDKFAGGFHADEWKRNGITFKPSENSTSENYLHWLPLLLSGRAKLINNATLRSQTSALERSVTASGREQITHPKVASAHDDLATAAAGAMVLADKKVLLFGPDSTWIDGAPSKKLSLEEQNYRWRRSLYFRSLGIVGF